MQFRPLLLSVALAAALAAGAAAAQAPATALPTPAEFYFDADARTTQPVVAVRETGEAATIRLLKAIARNPHAKAEHAHLAHLAMEGGRTDLGRELYGRALARITQNDGLWRPVMWNYGWDLYRAGDAAAALEQWHALMAARSLDAAWLPPTLAMVLWTLGRQDEAVQWYAAAVRTEPQLWSSAAQFGTLLPDWRAEERATLAEVQAAWMANPPAWP